MGRCDSAVLDRIAGVLVGTACGDALGAGYEFGPPMDDSVSVSMIGGGPFGFDPGEWTDDTSMAIAIAETAISGADLRSPAAQDAIVQRWLEWARDAKDVGSQTRSVFAKAREAGTAEAAQSAALAHHEQHGRSGGNGALMRTAPVALAFLDDPTALADAAQSIAALTHFDSDAADACVLWCLAIRHAVLNGELDVRVGLEWLPPERRDRWANLITAAEHSDPRDFDSNGWVVQAFQAAWSAITTTDVPSNDPQSGVFAAQHLQHALEAAVRGGNDTDTVAAIAGGMLGARWGVSAVPIEWQRVLHGWPGLRQRDLIKHALAIAHPGQDSGPRNYDYLAAHSTWTTHPHDDGVILGPVNAVGSLPTRVDAVVSLCRVDDVHRPTGAVQPENQIEVWLLDSPDASVNPNLEFVVDQAARAVLRLREEGRTVFLHCAAGQSRTPLVAAVVGARTRSFSHQQALTEVLAALPDPNMNPLFLEMVGSNQLG